MINSVLKNRAYLFLLVIVLFAGVLRFYRISEIPVSLYWDEVSSTYNAYSIANTGKDEFGNSFPFLFRAFEDYKTPANIYLTVIPVKIFGLNEFSARFTSAFLGTLTVLVSFLLIRELLKKKALKINPDSIALLTSALVAISPWHIQFSRTGFEANSGLFFVVLGAFLFFKFINSEINKYFYLSMATWSFSLYFYRSIWVFVPLLIVSLFLIYRKELIVKKNFNKLIIGCGLFVLILSPFIPHMASERGMVRANQVGIVNNSDEKVFEYAKKQENDGTHLGKILYNRRVAYVLESARGYGDHFSPNYLFFSGESNGRHGVPGVGILYIWSVLFIIPGIIALLKFDRKTKLVILAWIAISIIPAAVSVPTPHSLRILNMIPMPQLIISLGIIWIYLLLKGKLRLVYSALVFAVIFYFFTSYTNLYFGNNATKTSSEWADGYKQLAEYVFKNEDSYKKVIVSGHYWQPYIYFLFYKNYDPSEFQRNGSKSGFYKYIFGGTSWDMNGKELGDQDLEKLIEVVKEIKNHNNELVFIVGTLR
jgi:4-amino-4-deoxy-L-arabinose transferase-like glycosyltransferase